MIEKIAFKNIAFFCSHAGSSMRAIVLACGSELRATPKIVISNNPDSPSLQFAREHELLAVVLNIQNCGCQEVLDAKILALLQENDVDLIVLSGYMKKISAALIARYPGRILNIHPALLPKFGGQGMYGMNVHRAVIAAGEKESGATIHIVTENFDEGPIVAQVKVPVLPGDSAESLAERVKVEEPNFLVRTLKSMQL